MDGMMGLRKIGNGFDIISMYKYIKSKYNRDTGSHLAMERGGNIRKYV